MKGLGSCFARYSLSSVRISMYFPQWVSYVHKTGYQNGLGIFFLEANLLCHECTVALKYDHR